MDNRFLFCPALSDFSPSLSLFDPVYSFRPWSCLPMYSKATAIFLLCLTGIFGFWSLLHGHLGCCGWVSRACRKEVLYVGRDCMGDPSRTGLGVRAPAASNKPNVRQNKLGNLEITTMTWWITYTLWVHCRLKTPIGPASSWLKYRRQRPETTNGQELFKTDSMPMWSSSIWDSASWWFECLKRVPLEELVKEVVRKYALFFIQRTWQWICMIWMSPSLPIASGSWSSSRTTLVHSLKYTSTGGIEIYFKDQTLYIKIAGLESKIVMSSACLEAGASLATMAIWPSNPSGAGALSV